MQVNINAYSPRESIEIVGRAGVRKGNMRLDKMFMSSVSAGMILAFACATLLSTNASQWYQENATGLIRTIAALVFPYGLTIIVLTGADLCTGSFMFTTVSVLQRRLSPVKMVVHWFVTFFGNLAGSLFIVAIITGYGGIFDSAYYHTEAIKFAVAKQNTPEWHEIFLRAIGANWLVCLACYLGHSGHDYASKVAGIWFPTFAFVSLGLDHVVANMFFVPMGIWQGAPIPIGRYIGKGIVPGFLGNLVGGGLFVGAFYWYLHLVGEGPVVVDGRVRFETSSPKKQRYRMHRRHSQPNGPVCLSLHEGR
ncbi:putative formate/nitrite transporter [Saccharata proteae CBS 121410]|uniref:Putative formate/nitrite transporter n=1 Tax=Saccharata proteae CBS 121410 TaxID=1314787 RepID=A0A6A5YD28_9PEZI|nr:putative formate/nitrite transporter [Saccharata proteae CBS 121410]